MLRARARQFDSILRAADVLTAGAVFILLASRPGALTDALAPDSLPRLAAVGLLGSVGWLVLLESFGLYGSQRRRDLWQVAWRIAVAGLCGTATLGVCAWAVGAPVGLVFPFTCGLAQTAVLGISRLGIFSALRLLRRLGRNYRNVLILGTGPRAREVTGILDRNPHWGLRVVAHLDEQDVPHDPALVGVPIYKLVDTQDLLRREVIDEVLIATPRSMLVTISPVVAACAEAGVPVTLPSDVFGDYLPPPRASLLETLPALTFAPVHHSHTALALKRLIDVVLASALLVACAPIMAIAALAVRATSPGPVLFRQVRCGLYGRRFAMLKFRTMHADAEQRKADLLELNEMDGPVFKLRDDPRVTPVGRVLRRWSLDELPQLWNVLWGDMSIVGPRPPVPEEVAQYAVFERRRLSMRPGLTCLWQVMGRNSIGFADWVKLDLRYIDRWSLASDLRILLQTIPAVLRGTGH
jgi:exopolysaccharide biosynthesis polyprenyl glycosylphosphotransferase